MFIKWPYTMYFRPEYMWTLISTFMLSCSQNLCSIRFALSKVTKTDLGWHATSHITGRSSKCTGVRILLSRVSNIRVSTLFKSQNLGSVLFQTTRYHEGNAICHCYLQWLWFSLAYWLSIWCYRIPQEGRVVNQTLLKLTANKSTNRS